MRYIDPALRAKLLLAQQTYYQNAEPHIEVIVNRSRTPITYKGFWEEVIVTAGVTSISTSVAVRKTSRSAADRAYVAYVEDNNDLTVKSAAFTYPISNMIWDVEETISGCLCCALDFDGSFVRASRDKVEFRTEETPWLFYVTSTGQLMAGVLGGPYESLVGANVTAVDAVRGVASKYKDIDQGLLVFYVIAGDLYYRDLIDGVWGDQTSVSIAPADLVSVHAERTFDYRIVLQVMDDSGKLYEIFTKMEASGWNGTEYAVKLLSAAASVVRTQINYLEAKHSDEAITLVVAPTEFWLMSINPPTLRKAWNVPIELETPYDPYDDNIDYGYVVIFEFNQIVRNAEMFPADFQIEDAYGSVWLGQEVELNGRFVTVYFNNFNNAENSITATALAGNLSNGYTDLVETSVEFDAVGLVPVITEPPVPLSVENIEDWSGSL